MRRMDVFQAVPDPIRRSIVAQLAGVGEASAGQLAGVAHTEFGLSQPAATPTPRPRRSATTFF
jgi:DNA-binding transcriptional ArsR family regulator